MIEESPRPNSVSSTVSQGSIQVTSLLGNTELKYKELDSGTKESILTELLVKSAITHAINKQKVRCTKLFNWPVFPGHGGHRTGVKVWEAQTSVSTQ